ARRGQVLIGHPLDRVLEVLRGDRLAVTEAEALSDSELVHLAAPRHGELRCHLRNELATRWARLVRVVVELRCGRVFEPPRRGDVGSLRIDLDRGPDRAVLPDAALLE